MVNKTDKIIIAILFLGLVGNLISTWHLIDRTDKINEAIKLMAGGLIELKKEVSK